MSTLLLEQRGACDSHRDAVGVVVRPSLRIVDAHGGPTLDQLITSVWEGLATRATVDCPVCSGAMRPQPTAGCAGGGTCADCGARLT